MNRLFTVACNSIWVHHGFRAIPCLLSVTADVAVRVRRRRNTPQCRRIWGISIAFLPKINRPATHAWEIAATERDQPTLIQDEEQPAGRAPAGSMPPDFFDDCGRRAAAWLILQGPGSKQQCRQQPKLGWD
jgi:hypothetical protein